MKAFIKHFTLELKSGIRRKQQFFLNFFFPLGFYFMMGLIMPALNPGFTQLMIPSMVMFAVMSGAFLGIPDSLVSGRDSGIFRSFKINGVPALTLIILPVLTTVIQASAVSLIIILTAGPLFGAPAPGSAAGFTAAFLAASWACSSLAVFIGITASGQRSAVVLSQMIFVPSMVIGGLMIPFEMLPEGIRTAAAFLPSTHGMNMFSAMGYGTVSLLDSRMSAAVLAAAGTVFFLLSLVFFRWDRKKS